MSAAGITPDTALIVGIVIGAAIIIIVQAIMRGPS